MTAKFEYTDAHYPASTWIDAVYYNDLTGELGVVAQGRHYFYSGVGRDAYDDSMHGSAGSWYNVEVKGTYTPISITGHPDDPVNYVRIASNRTIGVRPGARVNTNPPSQQLVTPKAKATSGYRVEVDFGPQHPVYAESLEEALAKFKEDPMLYVSLVIKGVSSIDG